MDPISFATAALTFLAWVAVWVFVALACVGLAIMVFVVLLIFWRAIKAAWHYKV